MTLNQLHMQRSNSFLNRAQGRVSAENTLGTSVGGILIILVPVPVILVFTKCEAPELSAITTLQKEKKLSYNDAYQQAPEYAQQHLQNAHLDLESEKYLPQGHVYLKGEPML
jgi:hypothetical protein